MGNLEGGAVITKFSNLTYFENVNVDKVFWNLDAYF